MALSLLWVALMGAATIYATNEQAEFEKRVAAARASDPEAEKHGGLLLTRHGDICINPESWATCSVNPVGPHSPDELGYYWFAIIAVPAVFYCILQAAAWILRGFRRTQ
jgi:hypothetical protein